MESSTINEPLFAAVESGEVEALRFSQRHFPTFAPPNGETSSAFLRRICLEGLRKRYANAPHHWRDENIGGELAGEVLARLDCELGVIEKLGSVDYFLVLWDIVRFAEECGIYHTARGSSVGALVCYSLNMSHVCPLQHGLLFERFLDENRIEAPDIDIDYDNKRYDEIFAYIREKYGADKVARVGAHACAIVISDAPLVNHLPLALNQNGERFTQWERDDVEKSGILMLDILGLNALTLIAQTINVIKETTGETVDPYSFPLDDAATYSLFQRGETEGVFQFESNGIRQVLQRLKPDNFGDLIATNALYRPYPLDGGLVDQYIETKHGRRRAEYLHPVMEEILGETYGVMVYQEQVMQILNRLGGIPLVEAYSCIKAIAKRDVRIIDKSQAAFIRGAKENGISHTLATEIFETICKFSCYSFNKSHSTAYAQLAYMIAYLKVHYHEAFAAGERQIEAAIAEWFAQVYADIDKSQ